MAWTCRLIGPTHATACPAFKAKMAVVEVLLPASVGTELALFLAASLAHVLRIRRLAFQKPSKGKLSHLVEKNMPSVDRTLRDLRGRADRQGGVRVWQFSTQWGLPWAGDLSLVVDSKVDFGALSFAQPLQRGGVGGSDGTDRRGPVRDGNCISAFSVTLTTAADQSGKMSESLDHLRLLPPSVTGTPVSVFQLYGRQDPWARGGRGEAFHGRDRT